MGARARGWAGGWGIFLLTLTACEGEQADRVAAPPGGGSMMGLPGEVHLVPGPTFARSVEVANPYTGDPRAEAEGERLYRWFNCADCHGSRGGGGMGPPLRDDDWIFGGSALSIYQSIMEGRPKGMPSWHGKIPDDLAWKIVAYVQSLGSRNRQPVLSPPGDRVSGGGSRGGSSVASGGQPAGAVQQ